MSLINEHVQNYDVIPANLASKTLPSPFNAEPEPLACTLVTENQAKILNYCFPYGAVESRSIASVSDIRLCISLCQNDCNTTMVIA